VTTEQNKSAVTDHTNSFNDVTEWDHTISLNHVIDWDHAKVIDRESYRMYEWWIRETIHIRKEQDKSMMGPTNFHTSMITYCPPQQHLADSRSEEGSSGCQNVNKQVKLMVVF